MPQMNLFFIYLRSFDASKTFLLAQAGFLYNGHSICNLPLRHFSSVDLCLSSLANRLLVRQNIEAAVAVEPLPRLLPALRIIHVSAQSLVLRIASDRHIEIVLIEEIVLRHLLVGNIKRV